MKEEMTLITLKSKREVEGMEHSGSILADTHKKISKIIKPGLSTWEIEELAKKNIKSYGAIPSQIGFDGYKYATCICVNDEIAHGIPRRDLILKDGDIVKVDMCVSWHGYQSDSCWSYAVGNVSDEIKKLMKVTYNALYLGIDQAQVGNRIGDIGYAIQHYVEDENHYGDVRDLIGHGIQPSIHEDPNVPNYGKKGHGLRLKPGMTITIEPMVNIGTWKIKTKQFKKDNWEYYVTADGKPSCQYEHTLVITENGPKILTSQDKKIDQKYILDI